MFFWGNKDVQPNVYCPSHHGHALECNMGIQPPMNYPSHALEGNMGIQPPMYCPVML